MEMIRIVMLGITGVLVGIQFKSGKQEYGIYTGVCVCLLIFFQALGYLKEMKTSFHTLGGMLEGSGACLGILLKITGITYLSEFGAGICRDAGYQAVAAQIELAGKVMVLLAGMPVLLALADRLAGFMG